jgi:glutamate-1-semialdehyde 2,1-aminomutase
MKVGGFCKKNSPELEKLFSALVFDAGCSIFRENRLLSISNRGLSCFERTCTDITKEAGICVTINRVGWIISGFFTDRTVRNFTEIQLTDIKDWKKFFAQMFEQGIYRSQIALEAMFV